MKQKIKAFVLYIVKVLPSTMNAYFSDIIKWLKYSIKDNNRVNRQHAQARLLLHLHGLEKGLSFKEIRKGFGKDKAENLLLRTEKYILKYEVDEVSLLSLGVLNSFINHPNAGVSQSLKGGFDAILSSHNIKAAELQGGVKPMHKPVHLKYDTSFSELYTVASARASVRHYSDEEITLSEIENAVKYAQTAPSVCNRQASRIHVFSNNIDKILQTQLGNQGWAHKANKLFVVTTDLNFFGSVYERNQVFIDGGMFAMQFVMGLHSQKIASCCKMYIRRPDLDKTFSKVTCIPPNNVPIMLILAGHYDTDEVNVPFSYRYKVNNSMLVHD